MADESSKSIMDLKLQPKSVVGPIFQEELDELIEDLGESGLTLDPSYLNSLNEFHGAIPVACFFKGGKIERFLNFLDSYTCTATLHSLNVNVVRNWLRKRNVRESLVPFASMPHGAFLCFDYEPDGKPRVVIWNSEGHDFDEELASSFSEFIHMLSTTPV